MPKTDKLAYGLMFIAVPIAYFLAGPWAFWIALICALIGSGFLYSYHSRGLEDAPEADILALPRPTIPVKVESSAARTIKDSDPLVYVDISSRHVQGRRETPFLLHNRGKSVAHQIRINPIQLSVGKAVLKEVDFLGAGDKGEVLPVVESAGPIFRHDMINFLHHEANAAGKGSVKEFPTKMSLTYQDVTGTLHFHVSFDLVYSPLNKMLI